LESHTYDCAANLIKRLPSPLPSFKPPRQVDGVAIGIGDCVVDGAGIPIALSKMAMKDLRAEVGADDRLKCD
jgi:hypothetical protein